MPQATRVLEIIFFFRRTYVLLSLPFGQTFYKKWTGHNLLTDNTLKKITQDVLVICLVIVNVRS